VDAKAQAVHGLLGDVDARALLVLSAAGDDPDRAWFTAPAKLGEALIVVPAGGASRLGYVTPMERDEAAATGLQLLTPEALDVLRWHRDAPTPGAFLAEVAAQALRLSNVAPSRIALGGRLPFGVAQEVLDRLTGDGWSFVSAAEGLVRARKRKGATELAEIRRVSGFVVGAFRRVAELLAAATARRGELWLEEEPLRVARLKAEVAAVFAAGSLEQPRANILAPGEEGGVPHTTGTPERILRSRESLIVDLFPRGTLFSDCTRTFCVGTPPEPLARAHEAVLDTLLLAHAEARPGVRGWDLQERVCARFVEIGYPTPISHPGTVTGYVHGLGHGVGYELHEYPSFKKTAGAEGTLEEGDVLTLEPGLYDPTPAGYGVRLEDLVWLGPHGPENLTRLPYALDPKAWPS
jgi:Xaa-Pro aminopeptidase